MALVRVAKRYAKSLLDLGIQRNIIDRIYEDMMLVLDSVKANRPLAAMFRSPVISNDKKVAVLRKLLPDRMHELTIEFLCIITYKNRERYIVEIANAFVAMYKEYKHIQPATVITAVPIDAALRERMIGIVAAETGSTVELHEQINAAIIGGYILRWGDRQIDASISGQLYAIGQDFRKGTFIKASPNK